jgi:RimJ/RimL family protein N-acetyltransferase
VYHISISHGWQTLDFGVLLIRQLPAYSVIKLDPSGPNPSIPINTDFWSLSASYDELSLVCMGDQAPTAGILDRCDDWTAFRVAGTMDFTLTGIVARISQVLADAHVGIFVVSTFDTDYILVNHNDADMAVTRWRESGIEVVEPIHQTRRLDFIELDYEIEDIAANNRDYKVWLADYPTAENILIARLVLESHEPSDMYQIRFRSTGEAIGSIGFKGEQQLHNLNAVEITYELAPSIHGQGLGTEAVGAIRQVARARGIEHLCAETGTANRASQEVLKKNRFEEVSRNDNLIVWLLSSRDA